MIKLQLSKHEGFALIICALSISGMFTMNITSGYRYSDFRFIYHIGWISSMALFYSAQIWSLMNSIALFVEDGRSWKRKLTWIIINLLPVIYFLTMMTISIVR